MILLSGIESNHEKVDQPLYILRSMIVSFDLSVIQSASQGGSSHTGVDEGLGSGDDGI